MFRALFPPVNPGSRAAAGRDGEHDRRGVYGLVGASILVGGMKAGGNTSAASSPCFSGFVAASADEYDESEGLSFPKFMIAGACAGIAEHTCMFPVDTIKTVMQAEGGVSAAHSTMISTIRKLVQTDGPTRLWRGLGTMVLASGPAHAMYFSVYEFCKDMFGGNVRGHHPFATGLAGCLATLVHDALMAPADVIKQRMQLAYRVFPSVRACLATVVREEGVGALYAGYSTTVAMNVPFSSCHFIVYESAKKILGGEEYDEDEGNVLVHFVSGGMAGAIAAMVTNPLDVVRTRLQTQGELGVRYLGMRHVIKVIKMEEGRAGFWRGLKPRVLFHMPAAAICWVTYEFVKGTIRRMSHEGADETDHASPSAEAAPPAPAPGPGSRMVAITGQALTDKVTTAARATER